MTRTLDFIAPLFVPGNRPELFEKAAKSGADAVIIDLEDAVAPDDKVKSRANLSAEFTKLPVLVRINGPGTQWFLADVNAACSLPFAGIVLPKTEMDENLKLVCDAARSSGKSVITLLETATGVVDAKKIAMENGVVRLAFGSIDYCVDIGCAHNREALLMARSQLVLASILAGALPPLDGVTATFDDLAVVRNDARYARDLGFGGKLCIHPNQILEVFAGFNPDDSEIAWARKILTGVKGVESVSGEMVDSPVRRRAQAILKHIDNPANNDDFH